MNYFKNYDTNGFINCLTTGNGQVEISEEEYNNILNIIRTSHKEGFGLKELEGGSFQYIQIPDYQPKPDGSYLKPFPYVDGMTVKQGKYYEKDGLILQVVQTQPTKFGQAPWFEQLE